MVKTLINRILEKNIKPSINKSTFVDKDNKPYWEFNSTVIKPTNVLQTTVGYQALLALLTDILEEVKSDNDRFKEETYLEYLKKCTKLKFTDTGRYPFTSVTKTILHLDMSLAIWPAKIMDDSRLKRLDEAVKKIRPV